LRRLEKIINNVIIEKINIKNSVLDYIRYKRTAMATCKEWTKKGSLEEFWNGAHLEDGEIEDLKIYIHG
jgi:hypothetical protein